MKPGSTNTSGNQENERGMASYLLIKTEKISHTTICGKSYADSLLEYTRGNFGALHAEGIHCDQYNVCRSPKESPASCNQVQKTWTSEYRCFAPTWQCSVPYCPFNCCNNLSLSFECLPHPPYSPDLAPSDFHVFGPLKEAMGCKSFRSDEDVQQAVHEWLHSQPK